MGQYVMLLKMLACKCVIVLPHLRFFPHIYRTTFSFLVVVHCTCCCLKLSRLKIVLKKLVCKPLHLSLCYRLLSLQFLKVYVICWFGVVYLLANLPGCLNDSNRLVMKFNNAQFLISVHTFQVVNKQLLMSFPDVYPVPSRCRTFKYQKCRFNTGQVLC